MTRGIADLPGAKLAYEVMGNGPPVVLIHGFSLDMRSWDGQFAELSKKWTVLRYDLRGFGFSSLPETTPYSHVADLTLLLQMLGLGAAHLVGLSLGANVALGCAIEHPDMVRSLVLVSSGLADHDWRGQRPPDAAMAFAHAHGVAAAKTFWLNHPLFASTRSFPPAWAALNAIVADYSGWHWENSNPMKPFTATQAQLGAVPAPSLIVSGSLDLAGYREIGRVLASGIPGARKIAMPKAGHLLTMEVPAAFNKVIERFFSMVGQ